MKIGILGGGSSYVPEFIEASIELVKSKKLQIECISLMDINGERVKLVGGLAKRMIEHTGVPIEILITTDSREAIEDADFIISQIRVGTLQDRIQDEKLPLKYGIIGQESTGPAGFSHALRAVPVIIGYAKKIERWAPEAWFIINTNPGDVITEAVNRYSKAKVVCINDSLMWLKEAIASLLNVDNNRIRFDCIGLQHLNWVTRCYVDNKDVTSNIINNIDKMIWPGRLRKAPPFDPRLIKSLNMIPDNYLRFYYHHDRILKEQKKAKKVRGETVLELNKKFLEICKGPKVKEKPKFIEEARGSIRWREAMIPFICAVANNENKILVVNTPNNGAVKDMDPKDIMEIPSIVNKTGPHPIVIGEIPLEIKGLIQTMKVYDLLTVKAAVEGSYDLALKALITNPLVPSFDAAKALLDDILKTHKKLLPNFYK